MALAEARECPHEFFPWAMRSAAMRCSKSEGLERETGSVWPGSKGFQPRFSSLACWRNCQAVWGRMVAGRSREFSNNFPRYYENWPPILGFVAVGLGSN